jgi:hypothetical protein
MIVVDHEPHSWFLLQDEHGLVLDVNCTQSFVSYSRTFRLDDDESARVRLVGHQEVDRLALLVQCSPAAYSCRNGGPDLEAASLAAIKRWQASQPVA